jgi:hypothetical protein
MSDPLSDRLVLGFVIAIVSFFLRFMGYLRGDCRPFRTFSFPLSQSLCGGSSSSTLLVKASLVSSFIAEVFAVAEAG